MSQIGTGFEYNLLKNNTVNIVYLVGELRHASVPILECCASEIERAEDTRFVLIDLSQLKSISIDAVPAFAKFQKDLRARALQLRLCHLSEDLKERLLRTGVVRAHELTPNLKEALVSVMQPGSSVRRAA